MKKEILSPMPGTVVDVLISKGDKVMEGQDAVVIDAMKMENRIQVPADGTVADVLVALKDKVAANQVMVVIE
ncbi:MAG: acetyl-CoA carboxylase biotin carboxyl carrier protein subunit [Desulfosarcina sp.]|nr:acetyl-CoA carboxylase biotin carboxyl carrier protein subunit [Desulfobacterales bacterium]